MSECENCGDKFQSIFGERSCMNCCKERQGVPTVRQRDKAIASLAAEVERLRAALESARAEALEEAAKVAEDARIGCGGIVPPGEQVAKQIRELAKGKE